MVIWLIGLSGSGKTTVGKAVYKEIKKDIPNSIFLDGDILRQINNNDLGHTIKERRQNADRMSYLCKYLSDSGIHVICGLLSLFHESQKWNRENIENYYEVYLKVDIETVIKRDSKGLYARAKKENLTDVVGIDIPFNEPANPDLVINNEDVNMDDVVNEILEHIKPLL